MTDISNIKNRLEGLVIFRSLLKDSVIGGLMNAIKEKSACAYAEAVCALYENGGDLSEYVLQKILEDENRYILRKAQKLSIPAVMQAALDTELETASALGALTSREVKEYIGGGDFLPDWTNTPLDYAALYADRVKNIFKTGYGIFAHYNTFVLCDGAVTPVKMPDSTEIDQLSEYELERGKVIANTKALVEGKPARNTLLYGDAGTGKSSTVKAVAKMFAPQGLRLIEVKKNQLYQLPALMDELSINPLKFIIFIDDLSFSQNDDNFAALKAILEGSVSAAGSNIAVYATSNRRHLIKENFSDRNGDDLHLSDTIEELRSLSARFGLVVTYSRPNKDVYLSIVHNLAAQYKIEMPEQQLDIEAEAFALRASGRSPRVAKQFIKSLAGSI